VSGLVALIAAEQWTFLLTCPMQSTARVDVDVALFNWIGCVRSMIRGAIHPGMSINCFA
jgi:hypothetical protein